MAKMGGGINIPPRMKYNQLAEAFLFWQKWAEELTSRFSIIILVSFRDPKTPPPRGSNCARILGGHGGLGQSRRQAQVGSGPLAGLRDTRSDAPLAAPTGFPWNFLALLWNSPCREGGPRTHSGRVQEVPEITPTTVR